MKTLSTLFTLALIVVLAFITDTAFAKTFAHTGSIENWAVPASVKPVHLQARSSAGTYHPASLIRIGLGARAASVVTADDATVSTFHDAPLNGVVTATDSEDLPLTFSKASDPAHGSVTVDNNGDYIYTPEAGYSGPDSFDFLADNGGGGTDTGTVSITVLPNYPPTIDPISDLEIAQNAGLQTVLLSGIGSGHIDETQTLSVSAVSDNPGLIPDPTVDYTSPDSTGSLSFTPAAGQIGVAYITVTVDDGQTTDNNTQITFEVVVAELPSLIVTTRLDVEDNVDNLTSLREAILYGNTLTGAHNITFNLPGAGPHTLIIFEELEPITGDISIINEGAGSEKITLRRAGAFDPFGLISYFGFTQSTVAGLTLTGGEGNFIPGGGIYSEGDLTVRNCTFSNNSALQGGAIYCEGFLTVNNSIFKENDAITIGGAIYASDELTLNNCTFDDNYALTVGAVVTEFGATINACTFTNNMSLSSVGALGLTEASTISASTFTGNTSGFAGAIDSLGDLTLKKCTFINNSAVAAPPYPTQGGAVFVSGALDVIGTRFSNNSAESGGALVVDSCGCGGPAGPSVIRNSTFDGNTASEDGGAILFISDSPVLIVNNTFSGNSATNNGGAFSTEPSYFPTVLTAHSTFSGNTAASGNTLSNGDGTFTFTHDIIDDAASALVNSGGGSITSLGYNLSSGDGNGFLTKPGDKINTDPVIGPLANNGGPTPTHAILAGSPALNGGDRAFDPNAFTPPLNSDQRGAGFARVAATIIDIGAYESPALFVVGASITEGNSGTKPLDFKVNLSNAMPGTVTVNYATQDESALQPADYISTSGTLTFAPGETSKTVSVTINGDTIDEAHETIRLNLSAATGALIADSREVGTINDDDPTPSLSINDVQVTETNGGTAQALFTITLSGASGFPVSVLVQSNSNGGSPVAGVGTDYIALPPTTLVFYPGQTTKTVSLNILGDTLDENDEKFAVTLSGAVHAGISDNTAVGTILDNDAPPNLSVSATNVTERNTGDTDTMSFTLTLSAASAHNISVQYKTANATAFPATSGADYVAVPQTTVVFLAGETTKTVTVTIKGDTLDETNERVALSLTNPVNATVGTINEGIIVDDDATPSLSINDQTITEGQAGTLQMIFTVTLSAASGRTVTVDVASGNGGTPAATPDVDFVAVASTPVVFDPGQTTKQVSITINGDTAVEGNEKFGVILSGAVNATIADNSGIGIINNDDSVIVPAPNLSAKVNNPATQVTDGIAVKQQERLANGQEVKHSIAAKL